MRVITYNNETYIMNEELKTISDEFGNTIRYECDIVSYRNLPYWTHEIFTKIHELLKEFNSDLESRTLNAIDWDKISEEIERNTEI